MLSHREDSGFVISDLHIFSYASLYDRYLPMLERAASDHRVVVLNGDTFDFKRSCWSNNEETTKHAIEYISGLCIRHPETSFYYLLGNHDCNKIFVLELEKLEKRLANLHVSNDIIKIGSCLFIHGDVCDLPKGYHDLAQLRNHYESQQRSFCSIVFAQVVSLLRLNVVEYLRHRKRSLAERILSYLQHHHPQELESSERIYFGHTHVPFAGFTHSSFTFFNTGSAIRGLRLAPQKFPLP